MTSTAVLIFDGDCGFCTTSARWIESHWHQDRARAVASQTLDDAALSRYGLSRADVMTQVWWVDEKGRRGAHRALAAALHMASGPWKILGTLLMTPPVSWIARPGYFVVARYRHLLPGSTESCRL